MMSYTTVCHSTLARSSVPLLCQVSTADGRADASQIRIHFRAKMNALCGTGLCVSIWRLLVPNSTIGIEVPLFC